jgi:benzoyl-CoA reductase/2-hydroxyglutaryl-CoA dehydratase subunit BcrC/BadD/HgdB
MIQHCYDYAVAAKDNGRHIVGIMCEYTPRELIMAADCVPVCLCGGSAETIAPAQEHLPANLCPLIKSTYGYSITKANPFLEMAELVVAETTCDGKKKMYELLAQTRPMYVLELPQKQQDDDAFDHWVKELRKFRAELESRFSIDITDEKIRGAIKSMNQERRLRRELAGFMKVDTPPLTGRQLLDFKSIISCMEADMQQYTRAIDLLKKAKVNSAHGAVRVLMTGVPVVHGAERVLDILESAGGVVVCMENCTGLKPIWEEVDESADDPILALAEKYFRIPCSVMTRNDRRLDLIRELAEIYHPHCIVELIWQACLTYDVESYCVRRMAEQELGLPYLRIETDYSPSDSARIALRVEALFETIRQKQDMPGAPSC